MTSLDPSFQQADWPVPANVRVVQTRRHGGVSLPPFSSLNLGDHVGDDVQAVACNRSRILPAEGPVRGVWLKQVHGTRVLDVDAWLSGGHDMHDMHPPEADAAVAREPGHACLVMTADCLPVLFCHREGSVVAAAHAGWRGLCDGILEKTVTAMACPADEILAWMGPAIGPQAFEVGDEVRVAFIAKDPQAAAAFLPARVPGQWFGNLFLLARQRLALAGVGEIYGGGVCTYSHPDEYFSYRREGQTGRMVSGIWLDL